jgi:WD40 repeat protein
MLVLAGACGALMAAEASAAPLFSPVPGSPYTTGAAAESVAFSPSGGLLASAGLLKDKVAVDAVAADGALTPVQGSPFDTNIPASSTSGDEPQAVAFSPDGGLLATANDGESVSIFTVGPGGVLTGVEDEASIPNASELTFSPDGQQLAVASYEETSVEIYGVASNGDLTLQDGNPIGGDVGGVAFAPAGDLLAVANSGTGTVGLYAVGSNGVLTAEGSPITVPAGTTPERVSFSPSGGLLAVADASNNGNGGSVLLYSVGSGDSLTAVTGSPFSLGDSPHSVAFSQTGGLLAAPGFNSGDVSVFSIGANNSLSAVSGSPFSTGSGSVDAVFSPNGRLLATANENDGTVSVLAEPSGPPGIQITTPAANASYTEGLVPAAAFTCTAGAGGILKAGTAGCGASIDGGASVASGAPLVGSVGAHTLVVTATDSDGTRFASTVHYTVLAPPHALVSKPTVSGTATDVTVSCTGGTGTCSATLTLTYTTGKASDARARKPSKRTEVLGSKTIKLPAGHHEKVAVKLNATGLRLLAKYHKLTVKLTIKLLANGKTTTTTKTLTFKLKAKKKH